MNYTEMIDSCLARWPERIDISDGSILEDNGGFFPALSEIWHRIEKEEEAKSSLHGLFSWSIFSGFHQLAREETENQKNEVYKSNLDPLAIYETFRGSFYDKENGWLEDYPNFVDNFKHQDRTNQSTQCR